MKTKILMVCLGNICRSPLAEGILKSKLDEKLFLVDSCGTAGYHIGNSPDPRSIDIALKNGIDIRNQKAAQFKKSDFNTYDHIYVMDESNYSDIIELANNDTEKSKVHLVLDVLCIENIEVPDPYYGLENGFEHVFQLLNEACNVITEKLSSN